MSAVIVMIMGLLLLGYWQKILSLRYLENVKNDLTYLFGDLPNAVLIDWVCGADSDVAYRPVAYVFDLRDADKLTGVTVQMIDDLSFDLLNALHFVKAIAPSIHAYLQVSLRKEDDTGLLLGHVRIDLNVIEISEALTYAPLVSDRAS